MLTLSQPIQSKGNTCPGCGKLWSEHYNGCPSTAQTSPDNRGSGRGLPLLLALTLSFGAGSVILFGGEAIAAHEVKSVREGSFPSCLNKPDRNGRRAGCG